MLKDYHIFILSGIGAGGITKVVFQWFAENADTLEGVFYALSILSVMIGLLIRLCKLIKKGE